MNKPFESARPGDRMQLRNGLWGTFVRWTFMNKFIEASVEVDGRGRFNIYRSDFRTFHEYNGGGR